MNKPIYIVKGIKEYKIEYDPRREEYELWRKNPKGYYNFIEYQKDINNIYKKLKVKKSELNKLLE